MGTGTEVNRIELPIPKQTAISRSGAILAAQGFFFLPCRRVGLVCLGGHPEKCSTLSEKVFGKAWPVHGLSVPVPTIVLWLMHNLVGMMLLDH